MRKYKYIILLIICISICNIVFASDESLKGKKIFIDAGHGGIDPGATYKEIKEKDLNLIISQKLKNVLEKHGAIVYMTRIDDVDLALPNAEYRKRSDLGKRAQIINDSDCLLYLSLHLNSLDSNKWSGAQVFYDDNNEENIKLGEYIQNQFKIDLKTTRELKQISNKYMYKRIEKPGVLLELGFLSNPSERQLLMQDEYQYLLVNSIYQGLLKYIYKK